MVVRIAIIGAGIVGMSSAVAVQKRLPEAEVHVIADRFFTHTTSHGSGGLFVPNPEAPGNEQWAQDGAKHFFSLASSSEAGVSGVNFISGFYVYNTQQPPPWVKYMINIQKVPPELEPLVMKFYKRGIMFTTVIVESSKYLPWLTERFTAKGGRLIQKTVESFDELCDDYDLVLNCAGVYSGKLSSDPEVHPVRGHLVRVSAPWIKFFVHSDDTHYFYPQSETCVVGGTRQKGRYDLTPEPQESERIMRDMEERLPVLKGAKILYDWIGLRPTKAQTRVEAEVVRCKGKQLKVIHNYGHGAFGISLSWGTAVHAADLAHQALSVRPRL